MPEQEQQTIVRDPFANKAIDSKLDVNWFDTGDRQSSPPASQRRPSSPPPEPIGDQLADCWFR
jgi:hypothetical protein